MSKSIDTYGKAVELLNSVFQAVNKEYFEGKLETPTITIQSSKKAYGYITTSKVWHSGKKESYELNIGAETLARPIENTVATVIHECVHEFCLMNNVKDTSNRGVYHNETFKVIAESKGLKIERDDKYGWTITSPTKETKDFCKKYTFKAIKLNRGLPKKLDKGTTGDGEKAKSSTRKYMCPICGNSCRATKEIHILCLECTKIKQQDIEYQLA